MVPVCFKWPGEHQPASRAQSTTKRKIIVGARKPFALGSAIPTRIRRWLPGWLVHPVPPRRIFFIGAVWYMGLIYVLSFRGSLTKANKNTKTNTECDFISMRRGKACSNTSRHYALRMDYTAPDVAVRMYPLSRQFGLFQDADASLFCSIFLPPSEVRKGLTEPCQHLARSPPTDKSSLRDASRFFVGTERRLKASSIHAQFDAKHEHF